VQFLPSVQILFICRDNNFLTTADNRVKICMTSYSSLAQILWTGLGRALNHLSKFVCALVQSNFPNRGIKGFVHAMPPESISMIMDRGRPMRGRKLSPAWRHHCLHLALRPGRSPLLESTRRTAERATRFFNYHSCCFVAECNYSKDTALRVGRPSSR
jgi:hypothetical protein